MKPEMYTFRLPETARLSDRFEVVEIIDDSLAGLGVRVGDVAIVFLTKDVQSGDLALYRKPGVRVIGRYYPGPGGQVRIEPVSDEYEADIFGPGEGRLRGRVVRFERAGQVVKLKAELRPVRAPKPPAFSWKELRAGWREFLAEVEGGCK